MTRNLRPLATACLLVVAPATARADGYKDIARALSKAAVEAKARRVAVLPFVFLNRPLSVAPVVVSERLTAQIQNKRQVELVERQLIGRLFSEQRLALTGALDSAASGRIGKLLNVDAVVSGTLVALGDERVEINARLIDARSGRILASALAQVKEDWRETTAVVHQSKAAGGTPHIDLSMVSIPQALYSTRCASCHGADGSGPDSGAGADPAASAQDITRSAIQRKSDRDLSRAIKGGGEAMPAFGELEGATAALTAAEIDSLTRLIRRLGRDRNIRDAAAKAGGRIFDRHCAACHGFDGRGTHLASGLFDVPLEKLDLVGAGSTALDKAQLVRILKRNKRKMLFRDDVSDDSMTRLWLYLQKLAKSAL